MYRALSPILDPTTRRVKPLPKRRRTSEHAPPHDLGRASASTPAVPDAEEPAPPTDSLAAQMALQAYYMPVLGGVQELFKTDPSAGPGPPVDLGGGTFGLGAHDEDEDGAEGDYVDHLQQPGNTKKRKVPANMPGAAHRHDGGGGVGAGTGGVQDAEDEAERPFAGGRSDREYDTISIRPLNMPPGSLLQRKNRLPRATLAALQHKELLKSRKRQLAAVLDALSHGDTLALDQALSASYPFATLGSELKDAPPVRVHLSRRRSARLARAFKTFRESLPTAPGGPAIALPDADFSFSCHSATSDRLVATREEVVMLHAQFEEELSRQAAKAIEAAKQAAAALTGPLTKRASKQSRSSSGRGAEQKAEQSPTPTKERGGKKKKRSALANASNPHHLRNYVPSRLPHSGQANATQANQNAQNLLSPLPLRFLSAELPPRRRKTSERPAMPVSTLANAADEWICPFCEYSLFYGDEAGYQRAVRSRKKILRRRRRARERAAAAASGTATAKTADKDTAASEDVYAEGETAVGDGMQAVGGKQVKEGDGGGQGASALG